MILEALNFFFEYADKARASFVLFVAPHSILEQTYIIGSIYHQYSLQNMYVSFILIVGNAQESNMAIFKI